MGRCGSRSHPTSGRGWRTRWSRSCDAATAEGARRWNDANVLALSLRTTSEALLAEILDDDDDRANVGHLTEIER